MDLPSVDIPFVDVPDNEPAMFLIILAVLMWMILALFAKQLLHDEQAHASAPQKRYSKWYVRLFAPFIVMAKLFSMAPENKRPDDRSLTR